MALEILRFISHLRFKFNKTLVFILFSLSQPGTALAFKMFFAGRGKQVSSFHHKKQVRIISKKFLQQNPRSS